METHIITLSDVEYRFIEVVDNHTIKLVNAETGEIELRRIADLEKEEIINKAEKQKRKNFFKYLEILAEKAANKELIQAYNVLGTFFMGMLATKEPRKEEQVKRIVRGLTVVQEGYLIDILTEYFISTSKPLMRREADESMGILKNIHLEARYGISKGQVSKIVTDIKNADIFITKKGEKGIYINPEFFKRKTGAKGEYIVRVYQEKMKIILKNLKGIFADKTEIYACVGILNRLGTSFHFATFQLCANPDDVIWEDDETVTEALERRPDAIKYYGTRELLRLVSDGEKEAKEETLKYRIGALAAAGAIMQHSTLANVYYIHPELMDRRFSKEALECEHRRHVIKDFKILQAASRETFNQLNRKREIQLKKSKDSYAKTIEKRKNGSSN